jgi:phospholipid/cholesterol/gamma-HCH transport system substrate-binding protein
MKRFSERNLGVIAVVGTAFITLFALAAINFSKLPFVSDHTGYGATFTDAAGLTQGDPVSIAGVDVGNVTGLSLNGSHVLVRFNVLNNVTLHAGTVAAAKVLTPLGQEYLNLEPAGSAVLPPGSVIPLDHTKETQTLVSTVQTGGNILSGINIKQLETAMNDTSQDLEAIPPGQTKAMLTGLAQLSNVIGTRANELAQLVQNVTTISATLSQHSGQLVDLIGQGDLVLQVLNQRHQAIDQLLKETASLTTQLQTLLAAHQAQFTPLIDDLNTVSQVLAKDGNDVEAAIPLLNAANHYLANVTGSGSFGDFVLPAALIPDNIIAQCSKSGAINAVTGCNP